MRMFGLVIALAVVAPACDSDGSSGPRGATLDGRTFVAIEAKQDDAPRPVVPGTRITLRFGDGTLTASAGCNTMSGSARLEGSRLRVGNLATTAMGCDPARAAQDEWLAGFLAAGPRAHLTGDRLTLTLRNGLDEIALRDLGQVEPDRPVEGVLWQVETIISGGTASSMPAGVVASVSIRDGKAALELGCNRGDATAKVGSDEIVFDDLVQTAVLCRGEPARVEETMRQVLSGRVAYEVDGPVLHLRRGDLGLDLRAR